MKLQATLVGTAFAALFSMTAAAAAANAFTTGNVNMRVAPGVQYPRITTIPVNSAVTIHGCTQGINWCDTSWRHFRGWVSARYLESLYQGRRVYVPRYAPRVGVPIITFHFGNYWDRHYRNDHWYRDRDRWRDRWDRHHHKRDKDRDWRRRYD